MNQIVLKVTNLKKQYKNLTALDGISFSLSKGEIVGFIGSNGAGKSTTIKLITGLIRPSSGKIEIYGTDIKNREQALENIGAVVENPCFYPYLSAKQNLEYFASFYPDVDEQRIDQVLKLVGLASRQNDKVKEYSLGMRQRLGIAQALLNRPKILVLDEPTNGLDAQAIVQVRNFLKEICKKTGVTIFISSHILSELQNLCDRFIIIDKGKIVKQFSKEPSTDKAMINTYLSVDKITKAVEIISKLGFACKTAQDKIYLHVDKAQRATLVQQLSQNGICVYEIGNVKAKLEQTFLHSIKK